MIDPEKLLLINSSFKKFDLQNKFLQAAILAVVYKESNFEPQSENLNYSKERIIQVWKKISPDQAKSLEHNPEKLGNFIYSNKYGNEANEGFKYRGRGLNQITFKDNYKLIGALINKDLIKFPDLLNKFDIASDALIAFFKLNILAGIKAGKFKKFGIVKIEDINSLKKALQVTIQTNAGLNTPFNNNIVQEGYNKALTVIKDLYTAVTSDIKKKPIKIGILIFAGVAVYFLYKKFY